MSFKDWLFSSYPNPRVDGQWGLMHILTLVACIGIIVALAFLFRKKDEKSRKIVLYVLVGLILLFEITRRVVNFIKADDYSFKNILYMLLARPMCAMMCWALIISAFVNKTRLYNFASFGAFLSALIFFAYPGVGFNNTYMLFENIYSIVTHSLLLITSISLITLRFADFKLKYLWQSLIYYGVCIVWALLEAFVLKIESDAMYFMPGNDVMEIVGLPYGAFLPIYILFMVVYIGAFYAIGDWQTFKGLFKKNKQIEK